MKLVPGDLFKFNVGHDALWSSTFEFPRDVVCEVKKGDVGMVIQRREVPMRYGVSWRQRYEVLVFINEKIGWLYQVDCDPV